jgi:ankyrin repeat protein
MHNLKRASILSISIVFAAMLHAAGPDASDQFYKAIRADDKQAVGKLLSGGTDVNTHDGRGATPLMYAAAMGSPAMMRQLLTAGADVNAKNSFDSTALMWCTNNLEKVRLLTDKGADVNARAKSKQTPLVIAAAHDGNVEVIRLLIKKGADVKAKEGGASDAMIASANANDTATVKLLLDQGADPKRKDPGGFTALINAASNGNAELVKVLLARGADVNAQSEPIAERVKNGPIGIGSLTPLLMSVTAGSPESVRMLLDAGADVNVKDVREMTPLMLAVATDHPNEKIIQMLLAKGPVTVTKSKANETALDWAAKFQHPTILPVVLKASTGIEPSKRALVAVSYAKRDVREAVEKSVALLQKSNGTFFREGGCFSCHAQNITTVAVAAARAKGVRVDEAAASEVARGTSLGYTAQVDGLLQRMDPPTVVIPIQSLFALSAERTAPDRITDALVHNIAAQQHADGSWDSFGIVRPPTSGSLATATAFGIRALRDYALPARKAEFDERIARAAKWLIKMEPSTTQDAVMQLLGAKWAGLNAATVDRMAKRVVALQRPDGGWAQTPYLKSDAYATGTALFALKEAPAVSSADAAYGKGVAYLLSTQAEDGSWYVASRAPKFQPYFDGGFPYGHDQWISQWATGYAALALSYAIPDTRAAK